MKSSYSSLMQSKYFNPAFNSAIFDGPIRIYFAQFHESLALKIYFLIQQKWTAEFARAKELSKATHSNIMIMIYPTDDSFAGSFANDTAQDGWICEKWNQDMVIALRGPLADNAIDTFMDFTGEVLRHWNPRTAQGGARPELSLG